MTRGLGYAEDAEADEREREGEGEGAGVGKEWERRLARVLELRDAWMESALSRSH